jgi:hypothetical protein
MANVLALGMGMLNVCNDTDWKFGGSRHHSDVDSTLLGRMLRPARGGASGGSGGRSGSSSGSESTHYDGLAGMTDDGDVVWPFDVCHDGRVPLAGQELLAIVVLSQWMKLGRIASQSALLGPLFQCVGIMLSDVLKWLVLTIWPLIVRAEAPSPLSYPLCAHCAMRPRSCGRPSRAVSRSYFESLVRSLRRFANALCLSLL